MPEWTIRRPEIFEHELDLLGKNARDVMIEMHNKMIYPDNGLILIPQALPAEVSDYTGLLFEILPVRLEPLSRGLRTAYERIKSHA
ncbi:MAG: hypothetical protein HQK60_15705 [Deltaproteobacteria bacterium]|nr:hypothetical protein [Deltaproteobacteria bacterium]